ncbi:MAG: type II toxin-antitoxin system RelE/ParE family toxin [Rhizobiales bacterium]|nr:type II toxin-antitoxin system RelE/ParE family toxin [Hyphomicrobiales bacterium]
MTTSIRVKLTERAELDLIDIWFAIANYNPLDADRFLDTLNNRIDSLASYPDRGAPRPRLGKGIRLLIEGNYLIIYRTTDSGVSVIRIVHGARDLAELLD